MPDQVGIVGIAHSDDVEHYEHCYRLGLYWERIVSVSTRIQEQLVEYNASFAPKCRMIRYGVPFDSALARACVSRRAAKPCNAPLHIVYAGRFVIHQKNIHAYVKLIQGLAAAKVPFTMTMFGDGNEHAKVAAGLAPFVEAGVVNLPGRVDPAQVSTALGDADAFVLLSDFEGLPLSLLEAMAVGCIPVVQQMQSGIPEVIKDGENGFIVPRRSMTALIEVFRNLQRDRTRIAVLSENVIASFQRLRLGQTDMAEAYAGLFDEVLHEVRTRSRPRLQPLTFNAALDGALPPPFLQYRPE
jgi:glycosyltransferase involved in cell wall biosynthesis